MVCWIFDLKIRLLNIIQSIFRPLRDLLWVCTMKKDNQPEDQSFYQLFFVLQYVLISLTLFMIKWDVTNDKQLPSVPMLVQWFFPQENIRLIQMILFFVYRWTNISWILGYWSCCSSYSSCTWWWYTSIRSRCFW